VVDSSSKQLVEPSTESVVEFGRVNAVPASPPDKNPYVRSRADVERGSPRESVDNRQPPVGQPGCTLSVQQKASQLNTGAVPNEPREHSEKIDRFGNKAEADLLHVGCGVHAHEKLPTVFRHNGWREIRLDIDPDVCPDFVASITDMRVISDEAVDAVYSSHNVEHLYPHEVPLALREMRRVLKKTGFALIKLPDLQEVARHVAEGNLDNVLYVSPMGPIAPLDILFGHRPSLADGNMFMAHRTGFTGSTLGAALINAGFAAVMVQRDPSAFCLHAVAFRSRPDEEQVASAQARLLPAPDRSAVIYTGSG